MPAHDTDKSVNTGGRQPQMKAPPQISKDLSVLEIHPLHTVADAREHLVRNGLHHVREHRYGQVVAEYLHGVALLAVNVGHVDHRHVHADVAHVGCLLAVYEAVTPPAAETAVESVGVADRYRPDKTVARKYPLAAVAHGFVFRHGVNLQYRGLQRAHVVYHGVVAAVYAVQPEAEAAHVELTLGKMLYAGRIVHVADYLVAERRLKPVAALLEQGKLAGREVVEVVAVGAYEV